MDAEDADFDAYVAEDAVDADAIDVVDDDAIEAERLPEESAGSVEARQSVGVAAGEQVAMVVPEPEPTGHADVDAAVERLRELTERPTSAHPDLYDGVHQRLQEVLAQIDHQDAGR
jgi:hypothetical protein